MSWKLTGVNALGVLTPLALVALRLLGIICSVGYTLIVTRSLGASLAGSFFILLSVAMLGALIVGRGREHALLKITAAQQVADDNIVWSVFTSASYKLVRLTFVSTLFVSFVLSLPSVKEAATQYFINPYETLAILAISILGIAQLNLAAEPLKALGRAKLATFIQGCLPHLITLIIVLALFQSQLLVSRSLLISWGVSFLISASAATYVLHVSTPKGDRRSVLLQDFEKELSHQGHHFLMANLSNNLLNYLPVIIVGFTTSLAEAGLFGAANRIAASLSLVLSAVAGYNMSKFSALYVTGSYERLRSFAKFSSFVAFLLASPVVILMLVYPTQILMVFGEDFIEASYLLIILVIGQAFSIASGSVGQLLAMCDDGAIFMKISLVVSIVTMAALFLFALIYGLFFATVIISAGLITLNSSYIIACKLRQGFWPVFWLR